MTKIKSIGGSTPTDIISIMAKRGSSAPQHILRLYAISSLEDTSIRSSQRRKMQSLAHIIDLSCTYPLGEVMHILDREFRDNLQWYSQMLKERIEEGIDHTYEKAMLLRCIIKYKDSISLIRQGVFITEEEYHEYSKMVDDECNRLRSMSVNVTKGEVVETEDGS